MLKCSSLAIWSCLHLDCMPNTCSILMFPLTVGMEQLILGAVHCLLRLCWYIIAYFKRSLVTEKT